MQLSPSLLSVSGIGRSRSAGVLAAALSVAFGLVAVQGQAQPAPQGGQPASSSSAPSTAATTAAERSRLEMRQEELRAIEQGLRLSDEQRRKIETELEAIKTDRAQLNTALVETTAKVQAAERSISEVERRLESSVNAEQAIRKSLEARRGVIAEILASLQRMGRNPPPALLIAPEDILKAIRTAMMLGGVVPELRAETQVLVNDLNDLVELRKAIAVERERLDGEVRAMAAERQRLAGLIDARRATMGETEQALQTERGKAQQLSRQALDLKDLIGRMEAEVESARRAAEAAKKAETDRQQMAAIKPPDPRKPADSSRLQPAMAFSEAKNMLPMPVSGSIVKKFGEPDGFGSAERGLYIATRPGAIVASPIDGWVLFSGTFRTYGQLLIINAGGGYYILLAGMARNNVEVGQFVLSGEPVGLMGDASATNAAALAIGATQPILYVEFRKDGTAIDSSPWWAKPVAEKVRG